MGLLRAASSAVGGMFADQWKDFLTVPDGLPSSAALFAPVVRSRDGAGRGTNLRRSPGVITNGSKFIVPEGYALVLMEEGGVTDLVTEPGNYEWDSDALDSQSFSERGSQLAPFVKASWERFKFGGRPSSEQQAVFVSLKELPGNRFGTASEIYWDDAYLNAQVGAIARGTYTLRIVDPILFIRNWVSADYLQSGAVFDFTDTGNIWARQLFHEVVGCLAQALSSYANDPAMANRMARIQQDTVGFAKTLSASLEEAYRWRSDRGLEMVKATIVGLEYDQSTRELLTTVQRADALSGRREGTYVRTTVADSIKAAAEHDGPSGVIGLAMATGSLGNLLPPHAVAAEPAAATAPETSRAAATDDPVATLTQFKRLLDAGLITQDDYDVAKSKVLGL